MSDDEIDLDLTVREELYEPLELMFLSDKLKKGDPATVTPDSSWGIFRVVASSDPDHRYRVQTNARESDGWATWITCTCPFGLHAGGGRTTCKHAASVALWIRENKR